MKQNLNVKQIIAITIAILGVIIGSNAQIVTIFGEHASHSIIACAGLINSILSSILAVLTSQGSTVKDVLAMKGVEKIAVNEQANSTLATIAIDPTQPKIEPTYAAFQQVSETAKNTPLVK